MGIYNIAQNPIYSGYIDGDDYSGIEAETLSGNTCTYSSPYWNERLNFIPTGETPVFTVHLNLIVLQKNNGTEILMRPLQVCMIVPLSFKLHVQ